jgi:predicted MFS family arabinose efflux permease
MKTLLLCLMLTVPALCQDAGITPYRWSVAALATANALDWHSTVVATSRPGIVESNPLARRADGSFASGRAASIKIGVTLGNVLVQRYVARTPRTRRWATWINVGLAAGISAVAVRNYRLHHPAYR